MNWKQIISMWVGIATIVFFGLIAILVGVQLESPSFDFNVLVAFLILALLTTLVTGGLIITFKDKEDKMDKAK